MIFNDCRFIASSMPNPSMVPVGFHLLRPNNEVVNDFENECIPGKPVLVGDPFRSDTTEILITGHSHKELRQDLFHQQPFSGDAVANVGVPSQIPEGVFSVNWGHDIWN